MSWSGGDVWSARAVASHHGAAGCDGHAQSVGVFASQAPPHAINGLSILVEEELELDPFEDGTVFLFCNRQRRILKALFWDATGFCLVQKRLEKHRFPWPQTAEQVREITPDQLAMLLSGIDFWHAHERLNYQSVV